MLWSQFLNFTLIFSLPGVFLCSFVLICFRCDSCFDIDFPFLALVVLGLRCKANGLLSQHSELSLSLGGLSHCSSVELSLPLGGLSHCSTAELSLSLGLFSLLAVALLSSSVRAS